jgi:hypothetical protein
MTRQGDTLKAAAARFNNKEPMDFRELLVLGTKELCAGTPEMARHEGKVDALEELLVGRAKRHEPAPWHELDAFASTYSDYRADALTWGVAFGLVYGRLHRRPPAERLRLALAYARRVVGGP